jgi:hypothetical protein
MQNLERDRRGYPIPIIILRDDNGRPHFQINDDRTLEMCLKERRCAICGEKYEDDIWLAGGYLSAFHPHGAYADTPTHHECGQYAMQVCPYLAAPSYGKRIDDKTLNKGNFSGMTFVDPTVMPERPAFFVLAKTSNFSIKRPDPITRYIIPVRPWLEVELWKDGNQITAEEARDLLQVTT